MDEEKDPVERVHHPDHYNWFNIECLTVAVNFPFCLGNAIKYIWRSPVRPAKEALVDLDKAIFYLEQEKLRIVANIEMEEKLMADVPEFINNLRKE